MMQTKRTIMALATGVLSSALHTTAMAETYRPCEEFGHGGGGNSDAGLAKVTNIVENSSSDSVWVQANNDHHTPDAKWVEPGEEYADQTDRHGLFGFQVVFKDRQGRTEVCTYVVSSEKDKALYGDKTSVKITDYKCKSDNPPSVDISCQMKFNTDKSVVRTLFTLTDP